MIIVALSYCIIIDRYTVYYVILIFKVISIINIYYWYEYQLNIDISIVISVT